MKPGVYNKISLLISVICFFLVQPVILQGKNEAAHVNNAVKESVQGSARNTAKRSADWSRRLHPSGISEYPTHIAEGSENVEVTPNAPRIVRRMRIQNGKHQNIETFEEINPQSRSSEGGTRIVRIKKFKRKPVRITTIEPETTSRAFTTAPSTIDSMLTSSSPYSHITVINKEVRNPKRKKKNKKKRLRIQYNPTPSYDSEPKLNGFMYITPSPEVRQMSMSRQDAYKFSAPNSYPEYGGFYSGNKHPVLSNRQNKVAAVEEHFGNNQGILRMNGDNYEFQPENTRMSQPLNGFKDINQPIYRKSMMISKQSAPKPSFENYNNENFQQLKSSESNNVHLKNTSFQLDKNHNSSENIKTEIPSTTDDKTNLQVTVQRTGDSSATIPTEFEEKSVLPKVDSEKSNVTIPLDPKVEPKVVAIHPGNTAIPQDEENFRQEGYRFPSRFPSLFYNRKNAFSDPFFDTHEMPSETQRTGQDMSHQMMAPLNLPFSPFYSSNNPQNMGYLFDHGMNPYHSEEMVIPGFQHSPGLTSLRRSILDTYGDDTTTSEPVTPFSIPKFEMPPIDFSDKGCQTVYKEVKTVPSDGPERRNSNAKSFVVTRECYFPNGLPTTERTKEVETTTVPNKPKMSNRRSKEMKVDSKES